MAKHARSLVGAVLAGLTVPALLGCGLTIRSSAPAVGAWTDAGTVPLSQRENAHGLWTGQESLIIGGSDAAPCPPSADCMLPTEPPLADGAAFDPRTRTWRVIADAPVPFAWADSALIGRTAYFWIPGQPGRSGAAPAFLAYKIDADRWHELHLPPGDMQQSGIVAAGDRIVAFSGTDEYGELPDLVFDPTVGRWTELVADPLSPSFDRSMAWSGQELILFDHELVANPGSERPSLVRAAALNLATGTWRRLPDSGVLGGAWFLVDGKLVNPMLGGADGGEVNNWGRTYPNGGVLDPATGEWSALPHAPGGKDTFSAGIRTGDGGHYIGYHGWILDAPTSTWLNLPRIPGDESVQGRTAVAAGSDLLVFGGTRWNDLNGTLLNDAWTWSAN